MHDVEGMPTFEFEQFNMQPVVL